MLSHRNEPRGWAFRVQSPVGQRENVPVPRNVIHVATPGGTVDEGELLASVVAGYR